MSARINLAPEIYQSSQRAKRNRRLATTIGAAVSAVAVALVIIGFASVGAQKLVIKSLKSSISSDQTKIAGYSKLQDAVTASTHLQTFNQLLGQRIYLSRFFTVLQNTDPQGVSVNNVTIDTNNQLSVTGTAQTYDLVTKFAKALEAYNVQIGPNASASQSPYFTNVDLASVSKDASNNNVDFNLTTTVASEVTTSGN